MTKLLIGLLGAGVIATGGYAAATSVDADPARTVSLPGATSTGGTTTGDTTAATTTADDVNDISGPCDEAEHANDPRCTGGAATDDRDDDRGGHGDEDRGGDDSSGHGSGDVDDEDDDEDRSGSNSGKG